MSGTATPAMGEFRICVFWFIHLYLYSHFTKVPAEHYSTLPTLYLYIVFSHCVISILHITAPKVPAEHYSTLPTLYLVLHTLIVGLSKVAQ